MSTETGSWDMVSLVVKVKVGDGGIKEDEPFNKEGAYSVSIGQPDRFKLYTMTAQIKHP
jgi:hypothetical protein